MIAKQCFVVKQSLMVQRYSNAKGVMTVEVWGTGIASSHKLILLTHHLVTKWTQAVLCISKWQSLACDMYASTHSMQHSTFSTQLEQCSVSQGCMIWCAGLHYARPGHDRVLIGKAPDSQWPPYAPGLQKPIRLLHWLPCLYYPLFRRCVQTMSSFVSGIIACCLTVCHG